MDTTTINRHHAVNAVAIAAGETWLWTQFGSAAAVGVAVGSLAAYAIGLHRYNHKIAPRLAASNNNIIIQGSNNS